ncbi:MAG: hypothetical protein V4616_00950 [Bacteroidota bacterium]
MNKHVQKLKNDPSFIADCEKDIGRHTVITILTENETEIPEELKEEIQQLLELINSENERMLKHIMKVCFCSKNGAEHILDELVDEMAKLNEDRYFVEKAGLIGLLEKAGFEIDG